MKREEFLRKLESVEPGVSTKETVEQSDCVAFDSGDMFTFNDEVACRVPSGIDEKIRGVVRFKPLVEMIRRLSDDEIEIMQEEEGGKIVVRGKNRRASFHSEKDVNLPIDVVDKPTKWKKLPTEFCEAADIVSRCSGNDASRPILAHVHIHPKFLEAFQVSAIFGRWAIETPVSRSLLVKGYSLNRVASLGVTKFCETPHWLHFKNSSGLVVSCRLYIEEFPNLEGFLALQGSKVTLPSSLIEEADRASVFSSENPDEDRVRVTLSDSSVTIESVGLNGSYHAKKKMEYQGVPISFQISSTVLRDVLKRQREVTIADYKMIVRSGSFSLVACLLVESAEKKNSTE